MIINESGLYSLIFGSKLESVKQFKKWVTNEVLPTIRKTGGYVNNSKQFTDK
ncbi:prophage antirepressor-like protein [Clostridium beijerinckii]|nr:prophage antirepressor-like protein [Clostridium beijerinckii]